MKQTAAKFIITIVALGCVSLSSGCVQDRSMKLGETAPEISAIDLNDKTVKLSEFRGKVVVLRFWSSRCRACAAEMPVIDRISKRYQERGLALLAVNRGDTREEVEKFVETLQISYPVLLDPAAITSRKYGITAVPTTVFIDRKGIAQKSVGGEIPQDQLEKTIVELL